MFSPLPNTQMSCLGGAVNQLVSLGLADGVLTAKPVITFWRHVIKRYTNFALEDHDLDFNQGQAQFGAHPSCNLDRIGDLVYWMYVRIDLPGIGLVSDDGTRIVGPDHPDDKDSKGNTMEPYWTHAVGQAAVERASFYIGGQSIDDIATEMSYVWEELSGAPGKRLQEMTGKFDALASLQILSRQPRTLYVPLYFWFTLNSGLALPLVSLQFHSVKVHIKFRKLQDLLKLTPAAHEKYTLSQIKLRPAFNPGSYSPAVRQPVTDLTQLTHASMAARILVTYVYLEQNERAKFAQGAFECVIPQHQHFVHTVDQNVTAVYGTGTNKIVRNDLTFNHTVMEIFWVVRQRVREEFKDVSCNAYNDWFNFCGPADIITTLPIDPVRSARLMLNNANRWEQREGRYFRLIQPYQHHTNIPDKFIYCYSFALQPQDIQPSGTCNFSRIDSTVLELELDGRLFYGPTSSTAHDGNSSVSIHVYARNWNVLRFKFGLGGLRFAN